MTISFKVSDNTKKELIEHYKYTKRDKTPPYAVFQANEADTVVTLYESGKLVFQGTSADIDADMWKQREMHLNKGVKIEEKNSDKKDKTKDKDKTIYIDPKIYHSSSIGSDEVGTGDYFGPIVVSSAFVSKENITKLEELGVKDSKKMNDDKIMEVVPKILKFIPYESIILTNEKYNKLYSTDINMNKLKAILHNKVLMKLNDRIEHKDYIIVDEFAKEYVYYNYLKETTHLKGITFLTKGEDRSLAVACASLISRYIFVKEFDKLGESVDSFLPKGASNKVDEMGVHLVKKHGIDILSKVSKLNFKNTEKIKELIKN